MDIIKEAILDFILIPFIWFDVNAIKNWLNNTWYNLDICQQQKISDENIYAHIFKKNLK